MPAQLLPYKKATTIQDVARAVGVSKSLASSALNGNGRVAAETRQAVVQMAAEMGYEANPFAQGLKHGRGQQTIALFVSDLDLGVGTIKARAMQGLLVEKGFTVPIYSLGFYGPIDEVNHYSMLRSLCRQKPRAIVCRTANLGRSSIDELLRFSEEGGHVVCYDTDHESGCDRVVFDREDNTYMAARHLIELGHRDIALFINGAREPESVREKGFIRAMNEAGLTVRPEWLRSGGMYERGGAELAQWFLSQPRRPTGICIVNDITAVAFLAQLQRAGVRIPEELSVVGHDDLDIAPYAAVPLTSASHPVHEISRSVVELLLSRIEGSYEGPPRDTRLRGKLVRRESTTAPNRQQ